MRRPATGRSPPSSRRRSAAARSRPPRAIVEDARAVVSAARAADAALPRRGPQRGHPPPLRGGHERRADGRPAGGCRGHPGPGGGRGRGARVAQHPGARLARSRPWSRRPSRSATSLTAAEVASAAQRWIVNAAEADKKLADIGALERVRPQFESAASLADLKAGADLGGELERRGRQCPAGHREGRGSPATCSRSWACWARTCSRTWMPPSMRPSPATSTTP